MPQRLVGRGSGTQAGQVAQRRGEASAAARGGAAAVPRQVRWRRGAGSALPQRLEARWQCSGRSGGAGARRWPCCSAWRRGSGTQAGQEAQRRGEGRAAARGGAAAAPRQVCWRRGAGSALPQRVQARWQCSSRAGGVEARGRRRCSAWWRGGQHSGRSGGAGARGRRCRSAWRRGGSARAGQVALRRGGGGAAARGGAAAVPRQVGWCRGAGSAMLQCVVAQQQRPGRPFRHSGHVGPRGPFGHCFGHHGNVAPWSRGGDTTSRPVSGVDLAPSPCSLRLCHVLLC